MLKLRLVAATFGLFAAAPLLALAQETTTVTVKSGEATEVKKDDDAPEPKETSAVTKHVLTLDGQRIAYTATAGTLILRDDKGKAKASMFYVAYVKDGADAKRPVTFSFNGGPGSAAVWVQMGAFGPKKVRSDDEGFALPPPGELADNPYSILDITDLVFIDPIGTGFSRPAPGVDPKEFWGLKGDITSIADLMRQWLSKNGRWASPKYIAGESYGTTRSAGLALYLQESHGIYLNGLVQVSTILNWQNEEMNVGNDVAWIVHFPSYAAAAWYHKKLAADLQQKDLRSLLKEAEEFALGEYAAALLQGDWLGAEARQATAAKFARLTGLSTDYVLRSNLRVDNSRFLKELLRGDGKIVGRLDMRFTGYDRDSAGEQSEYDPASSAVGVGYVALLNDHLRRTLNYQTDLKYESSADLPSWNWDEAQNRYVNVAEDLRKAMTSNPALRVLFTSGYYDLATPYFDTPFSVAHLGLPESLRKNIAIEYFEAGHMMYIRKAEHARLKAAIARFIVH